MNSFSVAQGFARQALVIDDPDDLACALANVSNALGFRFFALTHHVPLAKVPGIRLHNYPKRWERWFDANDLGISDPVHRASHLTSIGFAWSELPRFITLTRMDQIVLRRAHRQGLGNGFTVPAHVPGEAHGSCSFATAAGDMIPSTALEAAQLVGSFAFEAARRLWRADAGQPPLPLDLTERQLDCVIWMARGKSNWTIGQILQIDTSTVAQHLRDARLRCGAENRTALAIRALFAGTVTYKDVIRR